MLEHNVDAKKLSEELKLTTSSISGYLTGKAFPPLDVVISICEVLNIGLDDLVGKSIIRTMINAMDYKEPKLNIASEPLPVYNTNPEIIEPGMQGILQLLEKALEEKVYYKIKLEECERRNNNLKRGSSFVSAQ
jgi:transcriptional regulator with XRE-family HTH domain